MTTGPASRVSNGAAAAGCAIAICAPISNEAIAKAEAPLRNLTQ